MKSLISKTISRIQKLFIKHNWVKTSSYVSENKGYVHEQYHCNCCDSVKHLMKYWNRRPIIKIIKPEDKV
jgi:hypothetical protein